MTRSLPEVLDVGTAEPVVTFRTAVTSIGTVAANGRTTTIAAGEGPPATPG